MHAALLASGLEADIFQIIFYILRAINVRIKNCSKMPNMCSVYGCKSGYRTTTNNNEKVQQFTFPNRDKSPERRLQWIKACRRDFDPGPRATMCEKHFSSDCFSIVSCDSNKYRCRNKIVRRKIKPDSIPTMCEHQSKRKLRSESATSNVRRLKEEERVRQLEQDFFSSDRVSSVEDLYEKIHNSSNVPFGFHFVRCEECIIIFQIDSNIPQINKCLKILPDMSWVAFVKDKKVPHNRFAHILKSEIQTMSSVANALAFLKSLDQDEKHIDLLSTATEALHEYLDSDSHSSESCKSKVAFCVEQIELARVPSNRRRFAPSLLISCYTVNSASRNAYEKLREQNFITLPSSKTLSKLTRNIDPDMTAINDNYLQLRYNKLAGPESIVAILFDEIHVASRPEYYQSQHKIVGLVESKDSSKTSFASTVLCFMISSLASSYKDIVCMIPIDSINSEIIIQGFWNVVKHVSTIGFQVVAVVCDNHAANRKALMNLFGGEWGASITNPYNNSLPIFLLFDPTHNIKNFYNNFQKRREFQYCGDQCNLTAKFSDIEELYYEEKNRPLKLAPQLSKRHLYPSNLDKLSAKPALSVINEKTVNALNFYSDHIGVNWKSTALFLSKVLKVWNIMNVKTPSVGKRKRDNTKDPIKSSYDWKLSVLKEFIDFLDAWQSNGCGLSTETFLAWRQTCKSLIAICDYLLKDKRYLFYILLGKIQSDPIEHRFGWYRQMSGANYYISVRQLFESERKIRALSLLKFSGLSLSELNSLSTPNTTCDDTLINDEVAERIYNTLDLNFSDPDVVDLNAIYYVTGAIVRSELRLRKCDLCREILSKSESEFVPAIDSLADESVSLFTSEVCRGGFVIPTDLAYDVCVKCWQLFVSLKSNGNSLNMYISSNDHCQVWLTIVATYLDDYYTLVQCEKEHEFMKSLAIRFFHCLMKNFLKSHNDFLVKCNATKKAKLCSTTSKLQK